MKNHDRAPVIDRPLVKLNGRGGGILLSGSSFSEIWGWRLMCSNAPRSQSLRLRSLAKTKKASQASAEPSLRGLLRKNAKSRTSLKTMMTPRVHTATQNTQARKRWMIAVPTIAKTTTRRIKLGIEFCRVLLRLINKLIRKTKPNI